MSRIGDTPVLVPKDATLTVDGASVVIKGPKGELTLSIPKGISVVPSGDGVFLVEKKGISKKLNALHGTISALLRNNIVGVTKGWTKQLELSGVGYRATMQGAGISFSVGFSHPVVVNPKNGIVFSITDSKVLVSGIDKYLVGQTAASIRAIKPPEPYKGKGIKYTGEYVRRKAGKSAKAVGGAK
ncbi:MAG: 50S ribosomal protein L6 [Patescibacteria group bacterium]